MNSAGINSSINLVVYAALLTWVTIMIASMIRTKGWTLDGLLLAFGNRDKLPAATPLSGRAERAALNTFTNFVLFAVLVIIADKVAADVQLVARGAALFFWARVIYVPVYLIGIPYLRTMTWIVGIIGLGMIVSAVLCSGAG